MRFLVDRCAGHRLAVWLRDQGHEVAEVVGPDPGDRELLDRAAREERVLVTLDKHFLQLIFHRSRPHCGLVRLPDVPAPRGSSSWSASWRPMPETSGAAR